MSKSQFIFLTLVAYVLYFLVTVAVLRSVAKYLAGDAR